MKKLFLLSILISIYFSNTYADNSYFIDFSKVLNNSKAGAQAQKELKNRILSETKKFKKQEDDIRKQETEIVAQKKLINNDEYKKKINNLRKKVADLQKSKQASLADIGKSRNNSKSALLKAVNPILKKYMEVNNVRIILDKKSVIMGDTKLEITDQIINILNKELTSLN